MSGKKIFVIGPVFPWRGGISHSNGITCENLAKKNDVTAISFSRQFPRVLYPGEGQKESGAQEKSLDFVVESSLDSINPLSWLKIAAKIKRERPDNVIFQWWHTFFAPAYFTIAFFGKNGHTKFGTITQNVLPHEQNPSDRVLAKLFFSQIDYFITYASTGIAEIRQLESDKSAQFLIEPTTEQTFGKIPSKTEAQKKLGVKSPAILFFGFVREYKGLKWLLRAMPQIIKKVPGIVLIIAGEFWHDKSDYLKLISELGISKNVKIISEYIPNNKVPFYFRAADCVVMPYESSTQSGIIQLAYGLSTPIITTNVGGNSDFVFDMQTGLLVPPKDEATLAAAISKFYSQKLGSKFASQMKKKAAIFDWTEEKEKTMLGSHTKSIGKGDAIIGGTISVQKNDSNFAARNGAMLEAGMVDYAGQEVRVAQLEEIYERGEWVGMGGIILRYKFMPSLFLCVNKKYRGKGYGTKIVQKVLENKRTPVFLTVGLDNFGAKKIYDKAGFVRLCPWREIKGTKTELMFHL